MRGQCVSTPVKIAFVTVLDHASACRPVAWPLGLHAGLTLATSLGACLNAGLLLWLLYRRGYYRPEPGWLVLAKFLRVALVVLGAVCSCCRGSARLARGDPVGEGRPALARHRCGRRSLISARSTRLRIPLAWDFNRRETDAPAFRRPGRFCATGAHAMTDQFGPFAPLRCGQRGFVQSA